MGIHNLIYQATAKKRKGVRNALVCRWLIGLCIVSVAATLGVAAGILIATKPGEEVREDLKKSAEESVETVEKVIHEKTDGKKKDS